LRVAGKERNSARAAPAAGRFSLSRRSKPLADRAGRAAGTRVGALIAMPHATAPPHLEIEAS